MLRKVSRDKMPHEPFFQDFYTPADNYERLHIKDGRQGRRFHLGKILFLLFRIYTSLTSVSKPNILDAS